MITGTSLRVLVDGGLLRSAARGPRGSERDPRLASERAGGLGHGRNLRFRSHPADSLRVLSRAIRAVTGFGFDPHTRIIEV
ncbi:unnamed protein product [Leptosia nina]|uniref:Uncharacterized protein n=1 Tax=Leptosia nina TaxID=320188 RepID=A0AAV1J8R8_9NEOP